MTGTLFMALRVTCPSFITFGFSEKKEKKSKKKRQKQKKAVVLCRGLPLLCDFKMLCFNH